MHDALANFPNLRHKKPTAWLPSYSNCEQSPRYAGSELPAIWRIRTRLFESICNLPNSSICGLISWRLADVGGGKYRPICVQITSAPARNLVEIFSTDRWTIQRPTMDSKTNDSSSELIHNATGISAPTPNMSAKRPTAADLIAAPTCSRDEYPIQLNRHCLQTASWKKTNC